MRGEMPLRWIDLLTSHRVPRWTKPSFLSIHNLISPLHGGFPGPGALVAMWIASLGTMALTRAMNLRVFGWLWMPGEGGPVYAPQASTATNGAEHPA